LIAEGVASWEGPGITPGTVQPYASFNDLCAAFGLHVTQQWERVSKDLIYKGHLFDVVKSINAGTTGKRAIEDHGISLKRLPMWLARLEANRINEASRPKVIRYQIECADALYDYWLKKKQDIQRPYYI
jgi:P22_AR N-terminal domain